METPEKDGQDGGDQVRLLMGLVSLKEIRWVLSRFHHSLYRVFCIHVEIINILCSRCVANLSVAMATTQNAEILPCNVVLSSASWKVKGCVCRIDSNKLRPTWSRCFTSIIYVYVKYYVGYMYFIFFMNDNHISCDVYISLFRWQT